MGPIVWLIVAVVFAVAEMLTMDFSLLMLALSALAVSGVALADVPLWVEIVTFAVSSLVTLLAIRPLLKKRFHTDSGSERFSTKELEGKTATVVEAISAASGSSGMVSIDGNFWTAQAAHAGEDLKQGDVVQVLEIRGNTAIVWKGI
ncbi:NfeD family protein [Corynebacterium sp. zg254]|uniref:NfeD family protein n=1 Tax=Corynebacterium zhongnanshanii TaxID=2768834 RepID=A0ABQ6VGF6_9CORY|nr:MULTISPECIES: NfeD family protein [Corynebacterium]KAB3523497.1 NfeD family protein [Corynebacterium zhongnanshanii]MCR5913355.1 NfeD family protein [Corynebacterium sp. zg254]